MTEYEDPALYSYTNPQRILEEHSSITLLDGKAADGRTPAPAAAGSAGDLIWSAERRGLPAGSEKTVAPAKLKCLDSRRKAFLIQAENPGRLTFPDPSQRF